MDAVLNNFTLSMPDSIALNLIKNNAWSEQKQNKVAKF